MNGMMRWLLIGGMIAISGFAARAEEAVTLKDAPGRDVVEGYCGACHSLDYPRINATFLNRKGWDSEVDKMIKAYGAPISAADAKTIVDYLTANYGSGG
jgi:sulfite dehydrogenase (cytochrome) subunit B